MARPTDSYAFFNERASQLSDTARVDDNGIFFLNPNNSSGEYQGISLNDLALFTYYHRSYMIKKYNKLFNYYRGQHSKIINQPKKKDFKPDNKIVVNLPKQLVKSFVGYFAGITPKVAITPNSDQNENNTEIKSADDILKKFNRNNNFSHFFTQEAKYVDIFGRALAIVYQDEAGDTRVSAMDPRDGFVIYADNVAEEPIFAVRYCANFDNAKTVVDVYEFAKSYERDTNGVVTKVITQNKFASHVELSQAVTVNQYLQTEPSPMSYGNLPIIEFMSDDERMGLYEDLISIIDAIDSAISEKKNDVDYFGDAILAIINMRMKGKDDSDLRDKRIFEGTATGDNAAAAKIEYLSKPTADETQENLITRLIQMVYDVSGIVNLNDKDFTNAASGKALKQRLQVMRQLANTKASFFDNSLRKIYSCLFTGFQKSEMADNVSIKFKLNEPLDLLDESAALVNLANVISSGVLSLPTALDNITFVEDVQAEITQIKKEQEERQGNLEDVQVQDNSSVLSDKKANDNE